MDEGGVVNLTFEEHYSDTTGAVSHAVFYGFGLSSSPVSTPSIMTEVHTIVMKVGMHCEGCARKVRKILTKMAGVEELKVDYIEQKVTVKGALDPNKVARKVSRAGKVVEILEIIAEPPKPTEVDAVAALPQVQIITLRIMMHCEGCARKVKYVLRKIPGVQDVEVHFKEQKVIVTGNVEMDMLLRKASKTGKQVEPWPMPPEEPKEESKEEKDAAQEEKPNEAKPEEAEAPKEETKATNDENKDAPQEITITEGQKTEEAKEDTKEPPKEENKDPSDEGAKQEEKKDVDEKSEQKDEQKKEGEEESKEFIEEVIMPSAYVVYRCDAPQIFSDDNPNACIIM